MVKRHLQQLTYRESLLDAPCQQVAEILRKGAHEISARTSVHGRSSNRNYINMVVEQAREIMENNLNRPLDMKELAANLYVSYSWFRKVFREQTGMAPAACHQHLRIEKAKRLLEQPGMSVRQVSESLGFRTQNHFSALFKRKTGAAPSAYR